ncbi:MAG: hypothetical protein ACKO96_09790, partial [Flammeovirgaceae bacterium]
LISGAGISLKKCEFPGCNFIAAGRCSMRRCGSFGCGVSFCLHHKARVVRLNKEYVENAICMNCQDDVQWSCMGWKTFITGYIIIALAMIYSGWSITYFTTGNFSQ